jgi:hypothetical protein
LENPFAKKIEPKEKVTSDMPTDDLPSKTIVGETDKMNFEEPIVENKTSKIEVPAEIQNTPEKFQPVSKPTKKSRTLLIVLVVALAVFLLLAIYSFLNNNSSQTITTDQVNMETNCEYNGNKYSPGSTFKASDGCNTCGCSSDGVVSCGVDQCESDSNDNQEIIELPIVSGTQIPL